MKMFENNGHIRVFSHRTGADNPWSILFINTITRRFELSMYSMYNKGFYGKNKTKL